MKIKIRILDICIYVILVLMISVPLIDMQVFTLDFISTNFRQILDSLYGKIIPVYGDIPVSIISIGIFQKVPFFIILFLSGYAIYDLLYNIVPTRVAHYTGLLYMINPFTYIRMISGQWFILFSYAILPLLLKVFMNLLERQQKKDMIKFILILSIVAFNIHILIISLIIMTIIFIFWFNKYKDIKITKLFVISGILFVLLNSYWIIPVLTAKNTIVDNITDKDFEVFAPKGSLFEIVSMYGFWREGYIYAKDFIPYWQLLSLFIISLAIYGFISYYKDEKIGYLVKALGVIGIIGFVLATGINGPFGDLNHWLYDNTILKGFRDSHKFVAMIVLAYAILGGLGINKIKEYSSRT